MKTMQSPSSNENNPPLGAKPEPPRQGPWWRRRWYLVALGLLLVLALFRVLDEVPAPRLGQGPWTGKGPLPNPNRPGSPNMVFYDLRKKKPNLPPLPTSFQPGPKPPRGIYRLVETGYPYFVVGHSFALVSDGLLVTRTDMEGVTFVRKVYDKNYNAKYVEEKGEPGYVNALILTGDEKWDVEGNAWGLVDYYKFNLKERVNAPHTDFYDYMPYINHGGKKELKFDEFAYKNNPPVRIWYNRRDDSITIAELDGYLLGKFVLDPKLANHPLLLDYEAVLQRNRNEIAKRNQFRPPPPIDPEITRREKAKAERERMKIP